MAIYAFGLNILDLDLVCIGWVLVGKVEKGMKGLCVVAEIWGVGTLGWDGKDSEIRFGVDGSGVGFLGWECKVRMKVKVRLDGMCVCDNREDALGGVKVDWWNGKLDSSNSTCLEIYNLLVTGSRHL